MDGKDVSACIKSCRESWENNHIGTLVWVRLDRDFVASVAIESVGIEFL